MTGLQDAQPVIAGRPAPRPVAWLLALCWALVAVLTSGPASAEMVDTPAEYAILMDVDTGQVLYSKNPDTLMAPASMSKLMTLTMLFERLKEGRIGLDDPILVSETAWRKGGAASGSSTMFAKVNSEVPVRDILRGIIVQSGNDACIAVAEAIGGTEENFAQMMTTRARELGLERSVFANSTGWPDPNHRMTARELALLARYMITAFPDFLPIFAEQSFTWNGITQNNRNPLIYSFRGADGLKTGHTEESGYGLVGTARQDGRRVIMVVNGLSSDRVRARETKRLMSIAFASFTQERLFAAGDPVGNIDVFHGRSPQVQAVTDRNITAFIHRSVRRDIKIRLAYQSPLKAPIAKGTQIGTMTVEAPGLEPVRAPVYAGADVPELGIFGKALLGLDHLIFSSKPAPKPAAEAQPNGG